MPKFSVITPTTFLRQEQLKRPCRSLAIQTSTDYEHIIVNTSTGDIDLDIPRTIVCNLQENTERVIGRNAGMKMATGGWICWLDSDDEYSSVYLEKASQMIAIHPEVKCFNFATLVYHKDLSSTVRPAYSPSLNADGTVGEFRSGGISTGAFIFKREILEEVGYLPESDHPYGDAASFSAITKNPNYPQLESGEYPPMGNPWGDDYQMYYQITRKYRPAQYQIALYIQHVR
jgi:GT2 family glycosyltransferase